MVHVDRHFSSFCSRAIICFPFLLTLRCKITLSLERIIMTIPFLLKPALLNMSRLVIKPSTLIFSFQISQLYKQLFDFNRLLSNDLPLTIDILLNFLSMTMQCLGSKVNNFWYLCPFLLELT